MDIEKAIEKLPVDQVKLLAEWLEDYQLLLASSAAVFSMLDAEEGEGDQWPEPKPPGAKSGS
ncbi:MAG: hypothetical protein HYU36_21955 [Planctomycetes bacterium]|nr:hypothetical protein [Planctomycetota bacterium]